MKVIFITQEDPIYVAEFWKEFIKYKEVLNEKNIEISALISLAPLGKSKKRSLLKKVYGLYGLIGTLKIGVHYVLAKIKGSGIEQIAKKLNTKFMRLKKLHSKDFIGLASKNDLIVSVAASKIFKKSLLESPKYGCINIHSGPLPEYQGMMPVFWQLRDGKKEIGITIHKMNERIDKGEILLQRFVSTEEINNLDKTIRKTKRYGAKMMVEFLENFEKYYNNPRANETKRGTYFSFPTKKEAKDLKKMGIKLI